MEKFGKVSKEYNRIIKQFKAEMLGLIKKKKKDHSRDHSNSKK